MNGQVQYGLANGVVLGQRFKIMRILGQGGMAYVYLAQDLKTGRKVAVKVLKEELSNDEEFVHRFDTEAKAASSLNHPNIVRVLGVGEENGMRYMIQEYVEGTSLKEMIDHYGRLDWRVAVPIGIQVALALEQAHEAGVVHRDIKPHNILITPERSAMVTDFGIARATSTNTITLAGGNAMGSVHYFSPEQARGGLVGESADIYSLGILFYEMLTGDVPFDGDTSVAVAIKHLQEQAIHPCELVPEIPRGLGDIVMKCIQKSPRQRYAGARALIDELDAFLVNPSGHFGVVEDPGELDGTTSSIQSLNADAGYDKIHILERQIRERRSSRRREIGIVLTVLLIGIAIILAVVSNLFKSFRGDVDSNQRNLYKLSNYVGKTLTEVEAQFKKDGFEAYQIQQVTSADFAEGLVIEQDMAPGSELNPKGLNKLQLKISKGDNALRLGDYVGWNYMEAQTDIKKQNNWETSVIFETNDAAEPNVVFRSDPEGGSVVAAGGRITLYVSRGQKDIRLPDVVGKDSASASAMLRQLGVGHVEIVERSPGGAITGDPYVSSMQPEAQSTVPYGSSVTLYCVSWWDIHPTPTPLPSPSPTPTPSPTPSPSPSPTPPPPPPPTPTPTPMPPSESSSTAAP